MLAQVVEAAKEDNHRLDLPPSLVAMKGGEIVGAFVLGPVIVWWLHSKKCGAVDSMIAMEVLSLKAREMGLKQVQVLCARSSPYAKHMERFGCIDVGNTGVFLHRV